MKATLLFCSLVFSGLYCQADFLVYKDVFGQRAVTDNGKELFRSSTAEVLLNSENFLVYYDGFSTIAFNTSGQQVFKEFGRVTPRASREIVAFTKSGKLRAFNRSGLILEKYIQGSFELSNRTIKYHDGFKVRAVNSQGKRIIN